MRQYLSCSGTDPKNCGLRYHEIYSIYFKTARYSKLIPSVILNCMCFSFSDYIISSKKLYRPNLILSSTHVCKKYNDTMNDSVPELTRIVLDKTNWSKNPFLIIKYKANQLSKIKGILLSNYIILRSTCKLFVDLIISFLQKCWIYAAFCMGLLPYLNLFIYLINVCMSIFHKSVLSQTSPIISLN